MDERRYRAALICAFAVVLLCGVFLFARYERRPEIPADGTLVENCEYAEDRMAA